MTQIRMPDGRALTWAEYGDPAGRPVLVLHGTPGSRLQVAPFDEVATRLGWRLLAVDRPGYGGSAPDPDLRFDSYQHDVRALLTALNLTRPALLAVSGGAGFALGLASTEPEMFRRVVLGCPMVPGAPRTTLRGRLRSVGLMFTLARRAPAGVRVLMRQQARMISAADPARLERLVRSLPAGDRAVLRDPGLRDAAAADLGLALQQGEHAAVQDLQLYGRSAGLALSAISTPVRVIHGSADRNVPVAVARWLVDQLPDARLQEVADAGHLFPALHPDLLLDALDESDPT